MTFFPFLLVALMRMMNNIKIVIITRETGISNGMISNQIKIYNETGINGLENQNKPGNSLSKYSNKKNLKDMEKLQYGKYEIKN